MFIDEGLGKLITSLKKIHFTPQNSTKKCSTSCQLENANLLISMLNNVISGEQILLFLFAGFILGYSVGRMRTKRRPIVQVNRQEFPRQPQVQMIHPNNYPQVGIQEMAPAPSRPSERSTWRFRNRQARRTCPRAYRTGQGSSPFHTHRIQNTGHGVSMFPSAPPLTPIPPHMNGDIY